METTMWVIGSSGNTAGFRLRFIRTFLFGVVFILALTGGAKLLSSFGGSQILEQSDPLFGIQNRYLLAVAGALELLIAIALLLLKEAKLCIQIVGATAGAFGIYRLGIKVINPPTQCPCLGTFFESFSISERATAIVTNSFFLYLAFGSICAWLLFQPAKESPVTK